MSSQLLDALREQEVRYQALFETILDGVICVDSHGAIQMANPSAERMFGYGPGELKGHNFHVLMPEPYRSKYKDFVNPFDNTRKAHENGIGRELIGLRKDSTTFPIEISVGVMRLGGEVSYVGTVYDLTQRKALEMQLVTARKMEGLGRLAGGIAHHYNNLLAVVLGNAEALGASASDADTRAFAVERITCASRRAVSYTHKLLAFASSQQMEAGIVNCNELMSAMADYLRPIFGSDIELTLNMPDEPCYVFADRNLLKQLVIDLAVNARDAMNGRGTLGLRFEAVTHADLRVPSGLPHNQSGYLLFSLSDTGEGMSEETQSRAFEPFFTTKGVGAAAGLGLATSYGVVKQNGGEIWITSRCGEGTTVFFCLPAIETSSLRDTGGNGNCSLTGTESVLVLEESPFIRDITVKSLMRHGYTCISPESKPDALRILEANPEAFDLVVADGSMLLVGSPSLNSTLTSTKPDIPVIVMSGFGEDLFELQMARMRCAVFLAKPFSSRKFLTLVRRVLNTVPVRLER